ncbi:hypothetical protein [Methylobacterium iners]|uniref:Uncharacterized protein n=1 Tax=Methylobacterium iners TaxID=418707 RepID=A0ABQ4RUL8_9HYPH|nr:hypothetical protein [Methylobacterium iners]GJD94536.1 hypothetical protein OCOJLMKI_1739 [Methylobacterium iners]
MPHWLFLPLCMLVFLPAGVAFCAEVWPLVMRRPLPNAFGEDFLLITVGGTLLSGLVTAMLMASERSRRVQR